VSFDAIERKVAMDQRQNRFVGLGAKPDLDRCWPWRNRVAAIPAEGEDHSPWWIDFDELAARHVALRDLQQIDTAWTRIQGGRTADTTRSCDWGR